LAGVLSATPSSAGVIPLNQWLEFGFTDPGVAATGCDPADPAGLFCVSSSGTPTQFLDAPPWTFVAPGGGATLRVTDAFSSGDRFEILDFGVVLGMTSLPGAQVVDCGDDPVPCIATVGMSTGVFALAPGAHSLTIVPLLSPAGLGAAYFIVEAAVPEPALLALFGGGLAMALRYRRRRTH
jgi:hypothetical protein